MRISAPKKVTFWVSVFIFVIGVLGAVVEGIPIVSDWAAAFLIFAYALLALGTIVTGL